MIRTFALLVVGLLALAPLVAAHPGHGHKVMGVVSTIHENQLVVKDAKDKETTFTLDAKTKITRGKTVLRSSEIKVGDRVVVTYEETKDKDGKTVASVKTVQVGVAATTTAKDH
jgi:hypothetical protein